MKRKRHTEEQIIAILKEHEAGLKTADLCRKHAISEQTFYNWPIQLRPPAAARCAPLPRRLRAADRRHHRPTGHCQLPDSNSDWIRIGGNVTSKTTEDESHRSIGPQALHDQRTDLA